MLALTGDVRNAPIPQKCTYCLQIVTYKRENCGERGYKLCQPRAVVKGRSFLTTEYYTRLNKDYIIHTFTIKQI